jgi:hypothetical protein
VQFAVEHESVKERREELERRIPLSVCFDLFTATESLHNEWYILSFTHSRFRFCRSLDPSNF